MKNSVKIILSIVAFTVIASATMMLMKLRRDKLLEPAKTNDSVGQKIPASDIMTPGGFINTANLQKVADGLVDGKPDIDVELCISTTANAPVPNETKNKYYTLLYKAGYIDQARLNTLIS
jgi:hypothetical protein